MHFFTPEFGRILKFEYCLIMGLILVLAAGLAWSFNNLNATRVETGPTESFVIDIPPAPEGLYSSNVMVQLSISHPEKESLSSCKTERISPALILNPQSGFDQASLISQ